MTPAEEFVESLIIKAEKKLSEWRELDDKFPERWTPIRGLQWECASETPSAGEIYISYRNFREQATQALVWTYLHDFEYLIDQSTATLLQRDYLLASTLNAILNYATLHLEGIILDELCLRQLRHFQLEDKLPYILAKCREAL